LHPKGGAALSDNQKDSARKAMTFTILIFILFTNLTVFFEGNEVKAAEQLLDSNEVDSGFKGIQVYDGQNLSQSFIASGTFTLTRISLYVRDLQTDDNLIVEIYDNNDMSDGISNNDEPGTNITPAIIANAGDIWEWLDFSFSISLTGGQRYWIVASCSQTNKAKSYEWQDSLTDSYPGGYIAQGDVGAWTLDLGNDLMFRIYGETQNDIGVRDILSPEYNHINEQIDITSIIQNFGSINQGSFDVRCVILNPMGVEIFNSTQNITNLTTGALKNLTWFFTPTMNGIYNITVITEFAADEFPGNDEMTIAIQVLAPEVLKLHNNIIIDGAVGDWIGTPPAQPDSGHIDRLEYIWTDAQGDDLGDGDYEYPTDTRFEADSLDLREFRVCVDSNSINFLLVFGSIDDFVVPDDGTWGDLIFSEQIIQILVDTDYDGTGRTDALRNARLKLDKRIGWEFALWADGWDNGLVTDEFGNTYDYISARGSPFSNAIEISIPLPGIYTPEFETWNYVVLVGAQDNNSLPSPIDGSSSGFMNVNSTASLTSGGNGEDANGSDSNVFDMAFAQPQSSQLNNYKSTDILLASFPVSSPVQSSNLDNTESWAQSFTTTTTTLLSSVEIYAVDVPTDSLIDIVIETNDDKGNAVPWDDTPSGIDISSTESVDFGMSYSWNGTMFTQPPLLAEGEIYWIVARTSEAPGEGHLWGRNASSTWPGGASAKFSGGMWTQVNGSDMFFTAYARNLTTVSAHRIVYFAPLVINQVYVNGSDTELIELYYNGTDLSQDLDMSGWKLTDQDGNDLVFENFVLTNKNSVTVHSGQGINTTSDVYMNNTFDVWNDFGDDVLLLSTSSIPVDFMSYTDGNVFGDPPPSGLNWGPENVEALPRNPGDFQILVLRNPGRDYDYYSDWGLNVIGVYANKTFYLYDDGSFIQDDAFDFMNTTFPVATQVMDVDADNQPGLTLRKNLNPNPERNYQEFNLTPILADDFFIIDDVVIDLYLNDTYADLTQGADEILIITLHDSDGVTKTEIANESFSFTTDSLIGWELMSFAIYDVVYNLPSGHYLVLNLALNTTSQNDLLIAFNTTTTPSCIKVVPTRTYVNVDWAKTYDIMDVEKTDFVLNEEVFIRANISDPLGSHDIDGANITIISPVGTTVISDVSMTLNATDPSNPSLWKLYNFTFMNTSETGIYSVIIKGLESNGVVHNHLIYFTIIGGLAPQLLSPKVTPISGFTTEYFNFTVNYLDLDNDAPNEIYVVINGLGTFNLSAVDLGDTDYTDGKMYYVNLSGFVNGTDYSFYFRAQDVKTIWNQTVTIPGPIIINTPPVLSNWILNPLIGKASTAFNYTITYTDLDNQPPDNIVVNISGPSHAGSWDLIEVDPGDTNYTDGKFYYYNFTGFFNGTYTHHFAANDSQGAWMQTIEIPGPDVEVTTLVLLFPDVTPKLGFITTEFNYTVTYVSLDNQPPSDIFVNITGPSHSGNWTMLEADPSDTFYVDGKEYYYSFTGLTTGNYTFHCAAASLGKWNETLEIDGPDVLNLRPLLSFHNLEPLVGNGTTVFNFTVTYIDFDNQTADSIFVNITGPSQGNYMMLEIDSGDTNYTDGKEYYFTITLPVSGIYQYKIMANDSGGLWADPVIDTGPNVDSPNPVFAKPDVNPKIGVTTTWFNFTVVYADYQNESAINVTLNLSGPLAYIFTMNELDPGDVNTTDGKIYYVNVTGLKKGQYSFFVEGTDNMTNSGTSVTVDSPLVQNTLPELFGGYINESGFGGSWFNFTMTYKDIDNDSADGVNLNIPGFVNLTMTELDSLDTNFTDGKEYYLNISLPKGSYSYRFEANDTGFGGSWNHTGFEAIFLMNNIPVFTTQEIIPASGFGGEYFNFTVDIQDYDNDTFSVILYIIGEPASPFVVLDLDILDLITSDGKSYYFNLSLLKGTYFYYFWVFDGESSNSTITLPFFVNNSHPVINTTDVINVAEDTLYSVDYNYTDSDGDVVIWSLDTNASWLTIDPNTGILSGTPTNLHVGSFYVNVIANDTDGGISYHNFTLNVTNTPPLISAVPTTSVFEDTSISDDFDATDEGQGATTYSLDTNATWLVIDPFTGVLSGTPDGSHIGWYWVNVTVSDGNGDFDSINYTITVNNKPPIILTIPITVANEDQNHIDDFNSDADIPGPVSYYLLTNATWLSITESNGILNGNPDNTHVGWYWVNITVDDGGGILGFVNYTLIVVNKSPSITTIPPSNETEDSFYFVDFDCDDDGEGVITYSLKTNATWLSMDGAGGLSGFCDNTHVGSYWINVSVEDGNGGVDFINYTFTVINVPPIISTIPLISVMEDEEYLVDFDSDDDGFGNVTYSLKTNASWLSLDPATGVLNGTANNTQVGWYWVNVSVSDGNGGLDFRNFSLTVINSLPQITTSPVINAFENTLYYVDFDCADDGQGNITYILDTTATWLSIDPATGEIMGTPLADDIGGYWVNVTVFDGQGGSVTLSYWLNVQNTNDAPSITTTDSLFAVEDSLYLVDYEYFDIDEDSVTWSLFGDANWLSIDPATGVLSGTPENAHVGSFNVNITIDDGNEGFDYREFILVVSNVNDPPSIPELLFPQDDSLISSLLPLFSWNASIDPDSGDYIVNYTLQYSPTADFSANIITISDLTVTEFAPTVPLLDKTTYYWRVSALDSNGVSSGFQAVHFVFATDTGYRPPAYLGGLKSDNQVKLKEPWTVDLDAFFELGSITEGLTFTSNYDEISIDPDTHIATWNPEDKSARLTNVTFTVSDGINEITSHPIDLSIEEVTKAPSIWDMIFWPWPLLSLVVVVIFFGFLMYRRIIYAPFVERVFLIHEHSILITHQSIGMDHAVDEDILSGMLAGVKNLISDAFGRDEEGTKQEDLRKLEFGDRNILLERGNHFFLAVVFTGRANKDLSSRIKDVVAEIEDRYTDELAGWEGYTDAFDGVDEIIATLLPTEKVKEEKEAAEIYVDVPSIDAEIYEVPKLPEEIFGDTIKKETYPAEAYIEVPKKAKEPEKVEDELDLVLRDYLGGPEGETTKTGTQIPPLLVKPPKKEDLVYEKKEEIKPPEVEHEKPDIKKGPLTDDEIDALPPPPWMKKETKPVDLPPKPPKKEEEKPKMEHTPPKTKVQEIEVVEYECPSCGAPITADMTKCDLCGVEFKFEDEGQEETEEYEYECPSCGAAVSANMSRCPVCGVQFASD
jgi:hypothetical protein